MPRLRLFGPLAEAAGVRVTEVPGTSVEECLDEARLRFGPAFSSLLPPCRVVVRDRALAMDEVAGEAVGADDELVLLPPVGGGDTPD